jgi:hypothetical protein
MTMVQDVKLIRHNINEPQRRRGRREKRKRKDNDSGFSVISVGAGSPGSLKDTQKLKNPPPPREGAIF